MGPVPLNPVLHLLVALVLGPWPVSHLETAPLACKLENPGRLGASRAGHGL